METKRRVAAILREGACKLRELEEPYASKVSMRERFGESAQQNTMDLVKDMSDADKQRMRDILSDNLQQGNGMRDTAKDLEKAFDDVDKKRAMTIARTETKRATNLAEHQKYLEKGYQSFTVISTDACCDGCSEVYEGFVFSMDEVDMLPPYHPNCMCVAVFHRETPEELAESEGLEVYGGGGEVLEVSDHQDEQEIIDEVKDVMEVLDALSEEEINTLIEQVAPDILGVGSEVVAPELTELTMAYMEDPIGFMDRETLYGRMVLELLRRLKVIV